MKNNFNPFWQFSDEILISEHLLGKRNNDFKGKQTHVDANLVHSTQTYM